MTEPAADEQEGLLSDLGVTAVPVARVEGILLNKVTCDTYTGIEPLSVSLG